MHFQKDSCFENWKSSPRGPFEVLPNKQTIFTKSSIHNGSKAEFSKYGKGDLSFFDQLTSYRLLNYPASSPNRHWISETLRVVPII